jgi:hypothetical protein
MVPTAVTLLLARSPVQPEEARVNLEAEPMVITEVQAVEVLIQV